MVNRFEPNSKARIGSLASHSLSNGTPSSSASITPERFILVGFMGVGKTEVGTILAEMLGYDFCDTDAMIEAAAGQSIPEIFTSKGEVAFRLLEAEAITMASSRNRVVIATGGGAPLNPLNRLALRLAGPVVLLTAKPATIVNRIGDPATRPLLADAVDPIARINQLMKRRRAAYASISDFSVAVDGRGPNSIAQDVINRFVNRISPKMQVLDSSVQLDVRVPGDSYPIWLGSGLTQHGGGTIIANLPAVRQACIVTHPGLRSRYADPLAVEMLRNDVKTSVVAIPKGESTKNLRTVARLYSAFVGAGLDRNGIVVAVGGGVIGDIAGFAAASYLRGVRCVQVPTTLLAQVDSSVGGKTGVDLPEGKNLVGAFHQPSMVLIDPSVLNTLPLRELRSGLAEVVKYGIITDKAFFYQTRDELQALLRRDPDALKRAIERSCEIKANVVAQDEKENGLRAILNFGHTVGHALESATHYKVYRHGEAIAIGMVSACLVGEELNITPPAVTREVYDCLTACGLPVDFPGTVDLSDIQAAMLLDKKTQAGRLRFVIAEQIGSVRIVDDVSPAIVERAIQRQKPS